MQQRNPSPYWDRQRPMDRPRMQHGRRNMWQQQRDLERNEAWKIQQAKLKAERAEARAKFEAEQAEARAKLEAEQAEARAQRETEQAKLEAERAEAEAKLEAERRAEAERKQKQSAKND